MHWLINDPWLVTDLQSLITRRREYTVYVPMEAMEANVVAGATIDAESHPTSGRVLYRSQEVQSCKNNVYIRCFFQVKRNNVSREEQRKLYRLTGALNAGGEAILYNQIYFGNR